MTDYRAAAQRRWPQLALAASLVLNGFLIGMLATDALRPQRDQSVPRPFRWELRRLASRLPSDALDQVKAELLPLAPQMQVRFEALRDARAAVNRLASEPKPDTAALAEALAALASQSAAMQKDVQQAVYAALLKLPPEARAGLARRPERR